jgi:hypothetical protein
MTATNRVPIRRAVNTEGTPFLNEEFSEGNIVLINGRQAQSIPLRYNSHEQNVEFEVDGNAYILDGDEIESFELSADGKTYTFKKGFEARRLSKDDFVQVLADGQITFFAHHNTSFQQGVASYGTATRQDRYVSNSTYFIAAGDDSPDRLRNLRERTIMRYINNFEDRVSRYARENRIDFSNPDDIANLLEYYNSLYEE